MNKIPSSILVEMAEAIIARYPRANHSCYTWEQSAEIIWNDAENITALNDAADLLRLTYIWNEQEN